MRTEKVYAARCTSYNVEKIRKIISDSFKELGVNIKEGSLVLLKPNLLTKASPESAVLTHYAIVDAVCRILKKNHCRIIIGDSSGSSNENGTYNAFVSSGIKTVADKHKAKCVIFEKDKKRKVIINGRILKELYFAETLFKADYVINLPKMKTHCQMAMTGAVKNTFGYVPGSRKQSLHTVGYTPELFADVLYDIFNVRKPDLNIMDGILALEGEGPGLAGKPKKADLILVSKDAFALDKVASRVMGFRKGEIKTNLLSDVVPVVVNYQPRTIKFKTSRLSFLINNPIFGRMISFLLKHFPKRPCFSKEKCVKCYECYKGCPQKAIVLDNEKYPKLNASKCISCFYCHEICRYKAISLKRKLF